MKTIFRNILFLGNYFATHLVGGNLAYEFVGVQPNGDFRYTLKLNYYFDCGSNSNWQPPGIPTNMSVAVYAHNDPTNILPSTAVNYPKYGSTDVDMVYNSTVQEYFEDTLCMVYSIATFCIFVKAFCRILKIVSVHCKLLQIDYRQTKVFVCKLLDFCYNYRQILAKTTAPQTNDCRYNS